MIQDLLARVTVVPEAEFQGGLGLMILEFGSSNYRFNLRNILRYLGSDRVQNSAFQFQEVSEGVKPKMSSQNSIFGGSKDRLARFWKVAPGSHYTIITKIRILWYLQARKCIPLGSSHPGSPSSLSIFQWYTRFNVLNTRSKNNLPDSKQGRSSLLGGIILLTSDQRN